ncbi:MAG: fatty acid desaturase [Pseudomonadota bacterium]
MNAPSGTAPNDRARTIEWPTFLLIVGCYGLWLACLFWVAAYSVPIAIVLAGVLVAFHASLTHEVLHGHPFPWKMVNEAMMLLPLNLCIPYHRFRDLHLAHHRDSNLTDPYDDPESNYLDPKVWSRLSGWKRGLYRVNNTLLGRMIFGPAISQATFSMDEWRAARNGDKSVWIAWLVHVPGAAVVLWVVAMSHMPVWAYLISAYIGLSLLKIRTFAEHRAHEKARGRTVVIEDSGPLAFLFLNNNLHVVHHMNPTAAWYDLPGLYRSGKDRYLACNEGYTFQSYRDLFRRHFWRSKDPVPHPLWPAD